MAVKTTFLEVNGVVDCLTVRGKGEKSHVRQENN